MKQFFDITKKTISIESTNSYGFSTQGAFAYAATSGRIYASAYRYLTNGVGSAGTLIYSDDLGTTWQVIKQGITDFNASWTFATTGAVRKIHCSPDGTRILMVWGPSMAGNALVAGMYIAYSADTGITWTTVSGTLTMPSYSDDLSLIIYGQGVSLYRVTNCTSSSPITITAAKMPMHDNSFISTAGEYCIYRSAATANGGDDTIYVSVDKGATWNAITAATYTALDVTYATGMKMIGVYKRGAYWYCVHVSTKISNSDPIIVETRLDTRAAAIYGNAALAGIMYNNYLGATNLSMRLFGNGMLVTEAAGVYVGYIENIGDLSSKQCRYQDWAGFGGLNSKLVGTASDGTIFIMEDTANASFFNIRTLTMFKPITNYTGKGIAVTKYTLPSFTANLGAIPSANNIAIGFDSNAKYGIVFSTLGPGTYNAMKTTDSGVTWSVKNSNISTLLGGMTVTGIYNPFVSLTGSTIAILVKRTAPSAAVLLLVSTDGGVVYTIKSTILALNGAVNMNIATPDILHTHMSGDGKVIIVMDDMGAMMLSSDSGTTWTPIAPATGRYGLQDGYGSCLSQNRVYINQDGSVIRVIGATTNVVSSAIPTVATSTDKGLTWTYVNTPIPANTYNYSSGAISQSGKWVVVTSQKYSGGSYVISGDGGNTWATVAISRPKTANTTTGTATAGKTFISNDGNIIVTPFVQNNMYSMGMPMICDRRISVSTFDALSTGIIGSDSLAYGVTVASPYMGVDKFRFIASDGCTIVNLSVLDGYNVMRTFVYPYIRYTIEKPDGYYIFVGGVLTKQVNEAAAFDSANQYSDIDATKLTGVCTINTYTNDVTYAKTLDRFSVVPKPQTLVCSSDILFNDKINREFLSSIRFNGNGNVQVIFSFDSGATWYNVKAGVMTLLTGTMTNMLASGSSPSDFNNLPAFHQFFNDVYGHDKIRFAFMISKNLISDAGDISDMTLTYKIRNDWVPAVTTDVTAKTRYQTCTVTFNVAGDYKINYFKP